MGDGGQKDNASRAPDPASTEAGGSGSSPSADELDSIYDSFLLNVAHAPSVDPGVLKEMIQRTEESLLGQQLAHFKVVERLGSGGMGVVYRAEDERLRRKVALKVLSAQLHGEQRQHWLLGEARSAAAVSHPNIAAIYEVGEAQGLAFIAMEYVEGRSLRTLLEGGALPVEQALHLAAQIARGLGRAHQGGIVHRDLKPDNVMVGPDGLVKLLDFGLASPLGEPGAGAEGAGEAREGLLPSAGRVVGTLAYMSPEQARGAAVDARSDVYSFGVLLFEMLAGRRPRSGAGREEALALAPAGAPEALAETLRRVVGRCLDPRPEGRYADGAALAEALRELPADRKEEPPASPRIEPPGCRGRARQLLATAVLALVAVGGWLLFSPEPERGAPEVRERRLTANPLENLLVDAALSPDGRVLAYTDQSGLYLRGLDPERTEVLGLPDHHPPREVAWFPGGAELLVTSDEPGSPGAVRLWRLRVATGQARSLGVGHFINIRVAPDGRTLAWLEGGDVRVADVEQLSGSRPVGSRSRDERFNKPCWSPDGKRLAYLRISQATASLETIQVETGERQVLLETPRLVNGLGESALAWGAGGELVYALCDLPPKEVGFSLWRLAVDPGSGKAKGRPRLIHSWSGFYPDLLSVGGAGRMAFARYEAQTDVYVGELSDGGRHLSTPRRLTLSERNEYPTGWSPDGQTLLFTSDRDGTTDIFMQRLGERDAVKLEAGRDFKTWPTLTPSGDGILFWRYPSPPDERPRTAELMAFRLPAGPATRVLSTRAPSGWTWNPSAPWKAHFRCAARAGTCVLGEQEGDELVFFALDPREGRGRELGRIGAALLIDPHDWALSPDGRRLALPGSLGELRVVELSSWKLTRSVVAPGCTLMSVSWSADGAALFATGNCGSGSNMSYRVFRVEPGRSQAQVLWEKPSTWLGRPMASPDGRHLALAVTPLDNDIWLVTDF